MFYNARLYFNLYGGPFGLLIVSYFLHRFGYLSEGNPYIAQLGNYVIYAGKAAALIAAIWVARNLWKLWRASQGIGDVCQRCGSPESYIPTGRYGPYYKCWKCGANCSERKHF
jgi:hypothetical protein